MADHLAGHASTALAAWHNAKQQMPTGTTAQYTLTKEKGRKTNISSDV